MRWPTRTHMTAVAASATIALAAVGAAPAHSATPAVGAAPAQSADALARFGGLGLPVPGLTDDPTPGVTDEPSDDPSDEPSGQPSGQPSEEPSEPAPEPSGQPSTEPPPPSETKPPKPPPDNPSQPTPPKPPNTPSPPKPPADGDEEAADPPADPDEAYEQGLEGAQTVAVAEAQRLLAQVTADLGEAEQSLAAAAAAASQARLAEETARQELRISEESVARTQRQIDELLARTGRTRDTLGAVAREAYQGSSLATLGVVLSARTPNELTTRYVGMRTLLRTGDSALSRLAVDEAELRNARARLEGQRTLLKERADKATAARKKLETAEQTARQARSVLDDTSDLVQAALQAAEEAKLEDYRRYMALIGESTAIGERLTTIDYGPGYGTGTFVRPGTGETTSEYGPRLHPILGYVKIHTGLDFGSGDGSIYAADAGTVIEAEWNDAYGNMVIVDHGQWRGQRLTTMYAHQADLIVRPGQKVQKGQVIGNIGSTGYSTGPHLHFEVRLDGEHTDPWPWVRDAPSPV